MRKYGGIALIAVGVLAMAAWAWIAFLASVDTPVPTLTTAGAEWVAADESLGSSLARTTRESRILAWAWPAGAAAAVLVGAMLALPRGRRP